MSLLSPSPPLAPPAHQVNNREPVEVNFFGGENENKEGEQEIDDVEIGNSANQDVSPLFANGGKFDLKVGNNKNEGKNQKIGKVKFGDNSSNQEELYSFARAPLNWDFNADRARPLPFTDEGAYGGGGGGTKFRNELVGGEAQVQMSYASHGNGDSTHSVMLAALTNEVTPTRKPTTTHRMTRSVKVTKKSSFLIRLCRLPLCLFFRRKVVFVGSDDECNHGS